ncbi:MAG: PDZ domain-containing protein, partial [Anaerovoracaceae bacterium]
MDRISVTLIRLIFFAILAVLVGMAVFRMFASGLPFSKSVAAGSGNYETASDGTISPDLVIPGGRSIGVKMDVEDVLVVGLEEIKTADGEETNPGLKAGLQIGDIILAIDGSEVHSASDVMAIVENTEKESVRLKIARKNEIRYLDVE